MRGRGMGGAGDHGVLRGQVCRTPHRATVTGRCGRKAVATRLAAVRCRHIQLQPAMVSAGSRAIAASSRPMSRTGTKVRRCGAPQRSYRGHRRLPDDRVMTVGAAALSRPVSTTAFHHERVGDLARDCALSAPGDWTVRAIVTAIDPAGDRRPPGAQRHPRRGRQAVPLPGRRSRRVMVRPRFSRCGPTRRGRARPALTPGPGSGAAPPRRAIRATGRCARGGRTRCC